MIQAEGITGTTGAGKGTLAGYLVEKHGYVHLQVRSFLDAELAKRPNYHLNEDSRRRLQLIANDLRTEYGPDFVVMSLYEQGMALGRNFVIESIRSLGEVESLLAQPNFRLWGVDADRRIRYDRIRERKGATDMVTFEEFCAAEDIELSSTNKAEQNLLGCLELAHIKLENNKEKVDFYREIESHMLSHKIEMHG